MKGLQPPLRHEIDSLSYYLKTLELMIKNGKINGYSIGHLANLIKPENESQFRFNHDPKHNWYHSILNGEKNATQGKSLIFGSSSKLFTLKGDHSKKITDYKFNQPKSPHGKTKQFLK